MIIHIQNKILNHNSQINKINMSPKKRVFYGDKLLK